LIAALATYDTAAPQEPVPGATGGIGDGVVIVEEPNVEQHSFAIDFPLYFHGSAAALEMRLST
jgi:hypothetical protein